MALVSKNLYKLTKNEAWLGKIVKKVLLILAIACVW